MVASAEDQGRKAPDVMAVRAVVDACRANGSNGTSVAFGFEAIYKLAADLLSTRAEVERLKSRDVMAELLAACVEVEKLTKERDTLATALRRSPRVDADTIAAAVTRAEKAEAAVEKLRAELRQANALLEWEDVTDEWTEAIQAAHPSRTNDPATHDNYGTAMRMVGNRHSKGELVSLVCWLLTSQRLRKSGE